MLNHIQTIEDTTRILLVEDDLLIAQDLKEIIEESGNFIVSTARNYPDAIAILSKGQIQLCLMDINLNGDKSGIDIAIHINDKHKIPFIFITSYSDTATIESVKQTHPSGFLLKPVSKTQILSSIKIALFSGNRQGSEKRFEKIQETKESVDLIRDNHFLIKEKSIFTKVYFDDVLLIEADRNYVTIKTATKKYMTRLTLKKIFEKLPKEYFVKCNKSYVINIKKVDSFTNNNLVITNEKISISRQSLQEAKLRLKNLII
jgi:DNA-binding LytR/AlgR family response regulator